MASPNKTNAELARAQAIGQFTWRVISIVRDIHYALEDREFASRFLTSVKRHLDRYPDMEGLVKDYQLRILRRLVLPNSGDEFDNLSELAKQFEEAKVPSSELTNQIQHAIANAELAKELSTLKTKDSPAYKQAQKKAFEEVANIFLECLAACPPIQPNPQDLPCAPDRE